MGSELIFLNSDFSRISRVFLAPDADDPRLIFVDQVIKIGFSFEIGPDSTGPLEMRLRSGSPTGFEGLPADLNDLISQTFNPSPLPLSV